MLTQTAPHYLLLTQAESIGNRSETSHRGGRWRFVLEAIGSDQRIEVAETEPGVWGERLQLLSVVRGLEALEHPAQVTLITPSQFVGKGIRHNLKIWKENDWTWERFGEMVPIKHVDLWQRIDRAMLFHRLDCRIWDFQNTYGTVPSEFDFPEFEDSRRSRRRIDSKGARNRELEWHFYNDQSSGFWDDDDSPESCFDAAVQFRRSTGINRITFEELQQARISSGWDPSLPAAGGRSRSRQRSEAQRLEDWNPEPPRVVPQGHGRAFGHYSSADACHFEHDGQW